MVKAALFFVIVFGIMFYPLAVSENKNLKTQTKSTVSAVLPDVKVEEGKFFIYKKRLEKKGDFKVLNIYKNRYVAFNLNVLDIIKNESYESVKTVLNGNLVTGYDVRYKNRDLKLITQKAVYNKKNKILNGGRFEMYSKDFRGYGKKFKIDESKNLYAENITYYLKVEK